MEFEYFPRLIVNSTNSNYNHEYVLDNVSDTAMKVSLNGVLNFCDYTVYTTGAEYSYDENGAMTMDANRGITKIEYDLRNNPLLIQFSDGSQTEYVYTSAGEKLRTIHLKASPNIQVSLGKTITLQPCEILEKDSTDYIENFVFEKSKPSKYLFSGGYYAYNSSSLSTNFLPTGEGRGEAYYYLTDHLGNNRVVVDSNDSIVQSVHYYPFGAVYADAGKNPDFQKYKYTGKELDLVHGLNTYDHGARQNYSLLSVWDRIDPFAEKYYNVSPYAVCGNNPINITDINGKELGNWEEFLFALKHPLAAHRIGSYNRGDNNISTNAVRFATRGEVLYGAKKNEDDRGSENGAFRHVLWQATITSEYGVNIAKEAGDAHEDNPNINMKQVFFTNITDADQSVDLHNNVIGRSLGNKFAW